jgi:hypothetical protein
MMQKFHAPVMKALAASGAITFRGCFDINVEVARRTARLLGAQMSGTPAEIRDLERVDALVIATSGIFWHPPKKEARVFSLTTSVGCIQPWALRAAWLPPVVLAGSAILTLATVFGAPGRQLPIFRSPIGTVA